MTQRIRIDLARLIAQAVPQVCGSNERQLLSDWLARNTDEQLVVIDLAEVLPTSDRTTPHPTRRDVTRAGDIPMTDLAATASPPDPKPLVVRAILPQFPVAQLTELRELPQPKTVSRQPLTRAGILAALRAYTRAHYEYDQSCGNAADRDIWLEAGGQRMGLRTLFEMLVAEWLLERDLQQFLAEFQQRGAVALADLLRKASDVVLDEAAAREVLTGWPRRRYHFEAER